MVPSVNILGSIAEIFTHCSFTRRHLKRRSSSLVMAHPESLGFLFVLPVDRLAAASSVFHGWLEESPSVLPLQVFKFPRGCQIIESHEDVNADESPRCEFSDVWQELDKKQLLLPWGQQNSHTSLSGLDVLLLLFAWLCRSACWRRMAHNCSASAPLCRDYTKINEEAESPSLPLHFLRRVCTWVRMQCCVWVSDFVGFWQVCPARLNPILTWIKNLVCLCFLIITQHYCVHVTRFLFLKQEAEHQHNTWLKYWTCGRNSGVIWVLFFVSTAFKAFKSLFQHSACFILKAVEAAVYSPGRFTFPQYFQVLTSTSGCLLTCKSGNRWEASVRAEGWMSEGVSAMNKWVNGCFSEWASECS